MIKRNLELAEAASRYVDISPDELAFWRELRRQLKLPRDPDTGRYRQDDSFHLLEEVDITE